MLWTERQQDGVFGGRRLQLEVELTAESFTEREPPRLVDSAAKRRVEDELHAAGFVKEPLEDERALRRDDAQRPPSLGEVVDQLIDDAANQSCFTRQPQRGLAVCQSEPVIDFGPKIADRERQLVAPRGSLSKPERHVRWNAARVGNTDGAGRHLQHAP